MECNPICAGCPEVWQAGLRRPGEDQVWPAAHLNHGKSGNQVGRQEIQDTCIDRTGGARERDGEKKKQKERKQMRENKEKKKESKSNIKRYTERKKRKIMAFTK